MGRDNATSAGMARIRDVDTSLWPVSPDDPCSSRQYDWGKVDSAIQQLTVFKNVTHGTQYAYRKGCTCSECRAWKAENMRAYRERRKRRDQWDRLMKRIQTNG